MKTNRGFGGGKWLVAAGVLGAFAVARADDLDELLQRFQTALASSVQAETETAGGRSYSAEASRLTTAGSRLERSVGAENYEDAQQALAQLIAGKLNPEARKLAEKLKAELPRLGAERQQQGLDQVSAALQKAAEDCLSARREGDLNETLVQLGKVRQRRTDIVSELRSRSNAKIDAAARTVNRWQDYLAQSAAGYDEPARRILRELLDGTGGSASYPLIPREKVQARLDALAPEPSGRAVLDVLKAVKSLEDLSKAVETITRINGERRSGGMETPYSANEIAGILKGYAAFKAGFYSEAFQQAVSGAQVAVFGGDSAAAAGASWAPEILRLRSQLLVLVLPRYLELRDEIKPKSGENPAEFLLRTAGEAQERGEWEKVQRILDCYRMIAYRGQAPAWLTADLASGAAHASGQTLEQAGQHGPAVQAYLRALKQTGPHSPVKEAGARLAALQREQPGAYADAIKDAQLREALETMARRPAGP